MKDEDNYNGWANKETWLVNLQDLDDIFVEMAQRRVAMDGTVFDLRDEIRDWVSDVMIGDPICGRRTILETDLLNCALGRVDWLSIAETPWEEAERASRQRCE